MRFASLLTMLCLGLLGLMPMQSAQAQNPTPNDWLCSNKVGGTWTHGRAPSGCDGSTFGPDSFVRGNYAPVIFNDAVNGTAERQRYLQELYAAMRDATSRYLLLRNPTASADEIAGFQRGVFALLRQESFWSHYRDAQLSAGQAYVLKMMRGDSGHGHGMMQLDDRYHFVPVGEGKGWNMMQNFSYAIEIYYDAWKKAPVSCLAGATSGDPAYWRSRARSAWSAYNGGPTKVCRWQNPADANVAKDNGYRDNYDNQLWAPDVADKSKAAAIDVACLMDNGTQCPLPVSGGLEAGKLIKIGSSACVLVGAALECVDDLRDAACLASRASFDASQAITVYGYEVNGRTRIDHNRHRLCRASADGLQALGSAITTTTVMELRGTIDGAVIGSLPVGTYQVLDFQLKNPQTLERYYRVRNAGLDGWIAAGDRSSYAGIASNAAPTTAGVMAYPGDWVAVATTSNLNIRATPGGALLTSIPNGTKLQVKELFGTASANNLYYLVEFNGKEGWIFAGNLYPSSTLASWTVPTLPPAVQTRHAACPTGTRYDIQLRQCMSSASVYGPFTVASTQQCLANGGGAACTALRGVVQDGRAVQLQVWGKALAVAARGNGDCPRGADRSMTHRYHCVEPVLRGGVADTDVYGPFGGTLVNACLAANANAAFCLANRWPASAFLALQP